jgi:hypothetical protein
VTAGAFIALMMLPIFLFPSVYESSLYHAPSPALFVIFGFAVVLAIAAGVVSFRGTLKQHARPKD